MAQSKISAVSFIRHFYAGARASIMADKLFFIKTTIKTI